MIEKFIEELATGWVWAILPLLGVWVYRQWHRKFRKRFAKFTLYRVLRLRFKERGGKPYYIRHHHTVEGETPVFDETWILNGVQCNYRTRFKPIPISSTGVVDAYQILPTVNRSTDRHPHRRGDLKIFEFSNREPSNRLAATGVLINGLQGESERWFATTAQYDHQSLTLVVDFSSLPGAGSLLSNVSGILEKAVVGPDGERKVPIAVQRIGDDIFSIVHNDAREGDVVKLEFHLEDS